MKTAATAIDVDLHRRVGSHDADLSRATDDAIYRLVVRCLLRIQLTRDAASVQQSAVAANEFVAAAAAAARDARRNPRPGIE